MPCAHVCVTFALVVLCMSSVVSKLGTPPKKKSGDMTRDTAHATKHMHMTHVEPYIAHRRCHRHTRWCDMSCRMMEWDGMGCQMMHCDVSVLCWVARAYHILLLSVFPQAATCRSRAHDNQATTGCNRSHSRLRKHACRHLMAQQQRHTASASRAPHAHITRTCVHPHQR